MRDSADSVMGSHWVAGQRATAHGVAAALAVLGTVLAAAAAVAQEPLSLRIDALDASSPPAAVALVTVRNAHGVPVPGLASAAFTVTEDGAPAPRRIDGFEILEQRSRPLAIVVAMDVSGSMTGQPLADAKRAALALLDQLGDHDRAALVAFADTVDLERLDPARDVAFTADMDGLRQAIEGLKTGGNTPLYDAAYKALRMVSREPAGNRAVLLFTDGRDEVAGGARGSGSAVANEDTPLREANRAGVPVFTVGLGALQDVGWLRRIAMETGGTYQDTTDSGELAALFSNVAALLKQQYRLTYASAVAGTPGDHVVAVRVRHGDRAAVDELRWSGAGATAPPEGKGGVAEPAGEATAVPAAGEDESLGDDTTPAAPGAATPTDTVLGGLSGPLPPPPPEPGLAARWVPAVALGLIATLALGGLALVGLAASRRRGDAARRRHRCLRCGRALTGPGAPCPTCGCEGEYRG